MRTGQSTRRRLMLPTGVWIVTARADVASAYRPSRTSSRRPPSVGRRASSIALAAGRSSSSPEISPPTDSPDRSPRRTAPVAARPTPNRPLIARSKTTPGKMERARAWLGFPAEGAVENLTVVCAHCNARLTPSQMDYDAARERLDPTLAAVFRPLRRDDATNDFLMRSSRRPWVVNWAQSYACTQLRRFVSLTDANAVLGRGKMMVLTETQARDLLGGADGGADGGAENRRTTPSRGTLLDVGAGEGEVTTQLAAGGAFGSVVATEASPPMCRALRAKGFDLVVQSTTIEDVASLAKKANVRHLRPDGKFECISLLNVLDRCDAPFTLLTQLRSLLAPGGTLVLAVVIPFRPFVEDGKTHRPPRERLPLPTNGTWEDGASRLWREVLKPAGFTVKRLARTPYICEGDQRNAAYVLDDAVFVLSASDEGADAGADEGADEGAESVEDGAGI